MTPSAQELTPSKTDRATGEATLVAQVQKMVHESGEPRGFDAAQWVNQWLEQPLPALGGATPAQWMGTDEGLAQISKLLAQAQSGAYA